MSNSKFLQIHTLTSYPATLLNRDDAGFAKRLPFGGATRTRISSQCLKYHWRNFDGEHALYNIENGETPRSYRSRETFIRHLAQPLKKEGHPEPLVLAGTYAVQNLLLTDKPASDADLKEQITPEKKDPWQELETGQITIFGEPEMRYLRGLVKTKIEEIQQQQNTNWDEPQSIDSNARDEAIKALKDIAKGEIKTNLKNLKRASGLDAALFGRMVTSDVLARGDAAIHVAHAFTTHEEESESDYFSAVDELRRDEPQESGELGAGHIGSHELTSGLFYQYVVVDIPQLVSNIEAGERDQWQTADTGLASEVIRHLVHLIATVSPGAKLGSTAPYSYAQCLLAESGTAQPRTLANAFHQAVAKNKGDVLANSYHAMGSYLADMDQMYGVNTDRRIAAMGPTDSLLKHLDVQQTVSVPDVADWSAKQIGGS